MPPDSAAYPDTRLTGVAEVTGRSGPERPVAQRRARQPLTVGVVFQPVVELATGAVVGYEALARGQGGGHGSAALFAAARAEGRVVELDWAARRAAVHAAREAGLRHPLALFVNAEP